MTHLPPVQNPLSLIQAEPHASWLRGLQSVLLAADYEGCLSLWDAEAAACTATFEEHLKRVWSADFSQVCSCCSCLPYCYYRKPQRPVRFGPCWAWLSLSSISREMAAEVDTA